MTLFIVSIVLWSVVIREDRKGLLTFAVLDVGQGDALFIESPTGIQVLVDGGPNKNLIGEISKILPWYDRNIDMLIVTNPDRDHYEGFISFLNKYSTYVFVESGTVNDSGAYPALKDIIKNKNITTVTAKRGQVIDLGGGAYMEILFPDRDVSGLSANDGSIIMKLVYGETSVLLTGDTTSRIEEYVVELYGDKLDSTILKAGHHGSKTSNTEILVNKVTPEWTVISSGANNSYGHPHKEVLDVMEKGGVSMYSTCNNGRIIFESDGKNFVLKNKNLQEVVVGCKI